MKENVKNVLITGGSRGIGAEMVRHFAQAGCRVAFTYLSSVEKAQALARETDALALRCDARSEADAREMGERLRREWGHADAVIVNAGVSHTGLFQDMTAAQWDDLFAVHVRGAFLTAREFLPGMISRQAGSILFVSSMWGQVGASCECAYSACKAALIGLTKSLAKEVGPSHVRVNCIAPGVIDTDMLQGYTQDDLTALCDETPLGRLGTPRDVARAALFLSGEEASFITGQVLGVNGGFVV
ncbi:MAG: SDR family oxidoreductase [Clostridiales bacterium]|nr:SDR family oxidoreductase [Clostridiales bacterium]